MKKPKTNRSKLKLTKKKKGKKEDSLLNGVVWANWDSEETWEQKRINTKIREDNRKYWEEKNKKQNIR